MQAPRLDEKVNLHFIAFVNVGGQLHELGELTLDRTYLLLFLTMLMVITFSCERQKQAFKP